MSGIHVPVGLAFALQYKGKDIHYSALFMHTRNKDNLLHTQVVSSWVYSLLFQKLAHLYIPIVTCHRLATKTTNNNWEAMEIATSNLPELLSSWRSGLVEQASPWQLPGCKISHNCGLSMSCSSPFALHWGNFLHAKCFCLSKLWKKEKSM